MNMWGRRFGIDGSNSSATPILEHCFTHLPFAKTIDILNNVMLHA